MSEWIKCSERLPGDSQDGYAVIIATYNSAGRFLSEVDVWCKGRNTFDYWGEKVTHWQPLPPPPEQE